MTALHHYPISPKLDHIPADIIAVADYQRLAKEFMPHPVYEYIDSGGADEHTLNRNRAAFDKIQVYNRVFADFKDATTRTQLLGHNFRHPILLAPVAHQQLVHREGELASAKAADAMEAGFISSTLSSQTLEDIAGCTNQPKWFQLYFQASRELTLALVRRAEKAGYSALVVTADVPINGLRNRTQRSGFQLPPSVQTVSNPKPSTPIELSSEQSIIFQGIMATAPNWGDLAWLREQTQLPILLKGLSHPADAERAIALGLDGIVVSNHGGRSLDGVPSSIEALPAIRAALGNDVPILLDSGVRRGSDIFKALALGADAVLIGRPQIYALSVAGALGVAHMIKLLRDELEVTMVLAGTPRLADIDQGALYPTTND